MDRNHNHNIGVDIHCPDMVVRKKLDYQMSLKSKCDQYDVAVKELFSLLDATEETDEGMDTDRGAGYINVVPLDKGKSEVS